MKLRERIFCSLILLLCIITTVSAEGTSIILDNDQTTSISGSALTLLSLAVVIFALVIIIKILLTTRGGE